MAMMGRSRIAAASGEDTLQVRERYLRRRSARSAGIWRRPGLFIAVGALGGWLSIAGIGSLFFR
jgi:hypothetical protein